MGGTLTIAGFAVPVWLIGAVGILSASMLMSSTRSGRRR